MQVLTAPQIRQLQLTAEAAYDALVIVEDTFCHTTDRVLVALTSDRAIAIYQTAWAITRYTALLTAAAAFYAGVLTRQLWNRFCEWADDYVQSCQSDVQTDVQSDPSPAIAAIPQPAHPIALLPAARERRHNTVIAPWTEDRILVTPQPVDMQTSTQPKRKRGRPRKVA